MFMSRRAKPQSSDNLPIVAGPIDRAIITVRNQRVMLDADLALLYGVATGQLNRAVLRNRTRFPSDFMFKLSAEEWTVLLCQFGISKIGRGGWKTPPYAFTQEGIAMLSSVLHSPRL